jgi:hypothetical protein
MRLRSMTTFVALTITSLLVLSGCGGSSSAKASHADVVAAAKAVCDERDAMQGKAPDASLSAVEQARAMAKVTEKYTKALNHFLGMSATDANDQRLIDQVNSGYKALRAVNPRDQDSLDRMRSISDRVSADIEAAGDEFACLQG